MRKLTILFAALSLTIALWAETMNGVKYLDAAGVEQTANNVTEVTNASDTLAAGWYVVLGSNVQTGTLVCSGAVHLILADNAKLTATGERGEAGIQVSGSASLAIYGQTNQTGELIATGGMNSAGIGGEWNAVGANITINGGRVTATGGSNGAGIGGAGFRIGTNITINGGVVTAKGGNYGAGIGGGSDREGTNITVNGGTVTAIGGSDGAGIGNGHFNVDVPYYSSNIKVVASFVVKADNSNPPATEIAGDRTDATDIAKDFFGKRYVTIIDPLPDIKSSAIVEINAAINGVTDTGILAIATAAITDISNATTKESVNSIKTQALTEIGAALLAKAKVDAIAEIDAAIKDLSLFSAEKQYIGDRKASITDGGTIEAVNSEKQRTFDYIALHDDKLTAIADVKTAMGDLAENEELYKFIGCSAIEAATDADKVIAAKNTVLNKLNEVKALCDDMYAAGRATVLSAIPTDAQDAKGAVVIITKGDKTLRLVNPDSVEYDEQ